MHRILALWLADSVLLLMNSCSSSLSGFYSWFDCKVASWAEIFCNNLKKQSKDNTTCLPSVCNIEVVVVERVYNSQPSIFFCSSNDSKYQANTPTKWIMLLLLMLVTASYKTENWEDGCSDYFVGYFVRDNRLSLHSGRLIKKTEKQNTINLKINSTKSIFTKISVDFPLILLSWM